MAPPEWAWRLVQTGAPGISGAGRPVRGWRGGAAAASSSAAFGSAAVACVHAASCVEARRAAVAIDVVEMLCQLLDDLLLCDRP